MKCAALNVRATTGTIMRKWKSATLILTGPPLANTMMNQRRNKKMKIKCPYCGSEDYECYDRVGDGTFEPVDLCVCEACDKQFQIVYTVSRIEKES